MCWVSESWLDKPNKRKSKNGHALRCPRGKEPKEGQRKVEERGARESPAAATKVLRVVVPLAFNGVKMAVASILSKMPWYPYVVP